MRITLQMAFCDELSINIWMRGLSNILRINHVIHHFIEDDAGHFGIDHSYEESLHDPTNGIRVQIHFLLSEQVILDNNFPPFSWRYIELLTDFRDVNPFFQKFFYLFSLFFCQYSHKGITQRITMQPCNISFTGFYEKA